MRSSNYVGEHWGYGDALDPGECPQEWMLLGVQNVHHDMRPRVARMVSTANDGSRAPQRATPDRSDIRDRKHIPRSTFGGAGHSSAAAPPFLGTNCFLALSRGGVIPSRYSAQRTHSSVIARSSDEA
jgi:hypothetical protein